MIYKLSGLLFQQRSHYNIIKGCHHYYHHQWQYRYKSIKIVTRSFKVQIQFYSSYLQSNMATNSSSSSLTAEIPIGVIQMTSTSDINQNIAICNDLIAKAKIKGAKVVFLPEAFDFIAENRDQGRTLCGRLDGPVIRNYQLKAKELDIWLSLGGYHERKVVDDIIPVNNSSESNSIQISPFMTNSHIFINNEGDIVGKYEKIHLFDMESSIDNIALKESSTVLPGDRIHSPIESPAGKIGLGICYDLRFPEFSLRLRQLGAEVLTFPSAFTVPTGQAHWHALLRSRAIENQCYVVAPAQFGKHNNKRISYGHSMVVDPWGVVVAEASDESPQLLITTIDIKKINDVRAKMPVIQHRKPSIYGTDITKPSIPSNETDEQEFRFGHVCVKNKMVFLEQEFARAFVNKKCVLPGHVLVSSKRPAKRLRDLEPAEVSDMFKLVQYVETLLEEREGASSSTVVIQDGPDAGQTIEHVHIHIIPRKPFDFPKNDTIYTKLAEHDKGEVQWREESEMEAECKLLRDLIRQNHSDWLTN